MQKQAKLTTPSRFYNLIPIKGEERKKVLVLCLLKALFSFTYTMLKLQKSGNVVTTHGAEKIAYVKSFVFPVTLILITAYTAFTNRVPQRKVLYAIIISFLIIFGLYAFVLIPYKALLSPNTAALEASWAHLPTVRSFIQVYRHWIQVFFYCAAELFGQFFIILFFWGIANELFNRQEAKRLYHIFIAAGYMGSMIGTQTIKWITRKLQNVYTSKVDIILHKALIIDRTSQVIAYIILIVLTLVFFLYRWLLQQPSALTEPTPQTASQTTKKEKKVSFLQAIRLIFANPYLIATTVVILSCGVVSSLIDVTYQKYIQNVSDSLPATYITWTANQLFFSDILCIVSGFFFSHWISRKCSWKFNAYITPCIMLIMGSLFFFSSAFNYLYGLDALSLRMFGVKASVSIAWIGFFQAILAVFAVMSFLIRVKKSSLLVWGQKYAAKVKGLLMSVGSRLGKSLSSYIHVAIFSFFTFGGQLPPVESLSLVIFTILFLFCIPWLFAIHYLGPKVEETKTQMPTDKQSSTKQVKKVSS